MENRFDIYDIPEGHENRFLEKFEKESKQKSSRRLIIVWSAAAALAALICTSVFSGGNGRFRFASTPEAVYCAYLDEVGDLYTTIAQSSEVGASDIEFAMRQITDEAVPMYSQLPEELSNRQKTKILKQYYGNILSGAGQIARQTNN